MASFAKGFGVEGNGRKNLFHSISLNGYIFCMNMLCLKTGTKL